MEQYLLKCLGSLIVAPELMEKLEVLVVNDGLKDRTSEIVHELESKWPQTFRVIDKENGSYRSCINAALAVVTGVYVKVLDADDYVEHQSFSEFLGLVNACVDDADRVDLIVSDCDTVNEEGNVTGKENFGLSETACSLRDKRPNMPRLPVHAVVYKLENRNLRFTSPPKTVILTTKCREVLVSQCYAAIVAMRNCWRELKRNNRTIQMNDKIAVGIIGCGFVGGALKTWLEENNPDVKILVSDPPKGYNDDLSTIDIAFLQIHVPTEDDGTQDLALMKQLITNLPKVPVFVRTTILPGTSDMLSKETGHQVCYMPEFLTERTHIEDFRRQTMVFTGAVELLTKIFVGKKFAVMTPLEAEITKYAHNVFGAYKVTYFNAVKEYCEKMGARWANVHTGCLLSGYINDTHTYVPGPDGKCGYGGKCFPKDVNAFAKMTVGTPLGTLLAPLHELNVHFRGFEEHI